VRARFASQRLVSYGSVRQLTHPLRNPMDPLDRAIKLCLQARDRGLTDVESPRHVCLCLAIAKPL
jgi:hypothetical protein